MIKKTKFEIMFFVAIFLFTQDYKVSGPNGNLKVSFSVNERIPLYSVEYLSHLMIEDSPLGLITNVGDFSKGMAVINSKENVISKKYFQNRIKKSEIYYHANELHITLKYTENRHFEFYLV